MCQLTYVMSHYYLVQLLTDKKGQWYHNIIDSASHEEPRIYVTTICTSFC